MYTPMLDWYRGECMVLRVNVNNGLQEPTCRCRTSNVNELLDINGYVKVRESLCIRVIIHVGILLHLARGGRGT